ncbi:class I SAM-dependent methyltransferase [Aurantimonas sp. MSK8Z-1]|uniref:class I SAM-dependent methyltransferase n=1 Tax=Mangrovibrevibacter kandeliae TaxID=2968473 RepID=UPI0021189773|nr:methyltransferase domain-containing protein [Aurantimonas sp. MSK8Z-1]MCW4116577.1 class I SAM-dependent methyltransferase [Aurantimonas sp. MSK8Z-1]
MNADILDLREFYASPLGIAAQRAVTLALSPVWRPVAEERLVGLGYALPYLERFGADAERTLALMPAAQGALAWPPGRLTATALVQDDELPLGDSSVDRILMVHALEFAEKPQDMLLEAWRVLAPGGRLVVVVPNRRGVWTRFEHTPFGSGRPWSRRQLLGLMRDATFTPTAWTDALLFPPFRRRSLLGLAPAMERIGRSLWPVFSGVVIVEATKQIYRGIPAASTRRRLKVPKPVLVPQGVPS